MALRPIGRSLICVLAAWPGWRLAGSQPSERSRWEREAQELGHCLRRERGLVLPLAIGVMAVLVIMITALADYTFSNMRSASRSTAGQLAYAAWESGLNEAEGVRLPV